MTLYLVDDDKITPVPPTTFAQQGRQERKHLQALLKSRPEIISPDTLIVAEEFSDWEDSRRRIDLLGIDKSANLVVIELKRTEDGGHMELQAVRYAAMISAMTFEILVSRYDRYLKNNAKEKDARDSLIEFLNWDDSDDRTLGQNIRIVLVSAEFSKELTTSVVWLNEQGLDIRCVRMSPYDNDGQVLLDVQTVPIRLSQTPTRYGGVSGCILPGSILRMVGVCADRIGTVPTKTDALQSMFRSYRIEPLAKQLRRAAFLPE